MAFKPEHGLAFGADLIKYVNGRNLNQVVTLWCGPFDVQVRLSLVNYKDDFVTLELEPIAEPSGESSEQYLRMILDGLIVVAYGKAKSAEGTEPVFRGQFKKATEYSKAFSIDIDITQLGLKANQYFPIGIELAPES